MFTKLKTFMLNHFENIIILVISTTLTILFSKYLLDSVFKIYSSTNLNSTFISLFGGLLGLLLAAYAIVFGIVPTLNKELLESESFLRINKTFLISVLLTIALLVLSIVYEFMPDAIRLYFLVAYLFLFLIVILEITLIAIILFLLLKITRKGLLVSK